MTGETGVVDEHERADLLPMNKHRTRTILVEGTPGHHGNPITGWSTMFPINSDVFQGICPIIKFGVECSV